MIMDGNGRWATARNLKRSDGHREGALAIDRLMDTCLELGLQYVSLYTFSTENWKRPAQEIQSIFSLLVEFIDTRLERIRGKGIRIHHSGSRRKIPKQALRALDRAIQETAGNKKLIVNFCLNYGSHDEICRSVESLILDRIERGKNLKDPVRPRELEKYLYTYPLPPVDLLIRTAGEERISNFLLWQIAYAEIYFTKTLWPDFGRESLMEALRSYERRIRKFGGL